VPHGSIYRLSNGQIDRFDCEPMEEAWPPLAALRRAVAAAVFAPAKTWPHFATFPGWNTPRRRSPPTRSSVTRMEPRR